MGLTRANGTLLQWLGAVVAALCVAGCSGPITPQPPSPPQLSCPANVGVTGVLGGTQAVTYTAPSVSGGAAPVSTTCAPPSGSGFPVGATAVTCVAVDSLNRQATCSFTVTLTAVTLRVQRFVAFGDSVTAGEDGRRLHIRFDFIDPVRSYPAVLQGLLAADFPEQSIVVANEGEGGRFATDDVQRLPGVLQKHQAEALLLLHGYNDLLNRGASAIDAVVQALRSDVRNARTLNVQPVLVSTLTPSRPATGPFNRTIDPAVIRTANQRIAQMVQAEGAHLVDAHAAFLGRELELVGDDGLHLTVTGNQVLAETFYAAIRAAGLTRQ